ncbi:MAG: RHS repeat-associated core domain-containing protein [Chthonomonadaceae bacterium]|nr:RHS repeat-associated core domain-containing protein [Chthonomonadaceae bacterium]
MTKVDKDWYGLGARGIDWQQHYDAVGDVTSVGFPLYDTHGNNVGSVSRSGTNDFTVSNERTYDAWGSIRSGANYPQQGYCANLGHRKDDESSLVYMRARYYEPSTGRFVSEDPARDGGNWFVYCENNGISNSDPDGQETYSDLFIISMTSVLFAYCGMILASGLLHDPKAFKYAWNGLIVLAASVIYDVAFKTKDGKSLDLDKLKDKQIEAMRRGFFGGVGAAVVMYYGMRSGLMLAQIWEMDYVDAYF